MKDKIEHRGVIDNVDGSHISVKIVQQTACSGCKMKSMCTSSESKEKIIDVYELGAESRRKIGDVVTVCGTLSMGKQAVVLAFGIPTVICVVWMFCAMLLFCMNELVAVGVLMALLCVYFLILYSKRDRMSRKFAFWIE